MSLMIFKDQKCRDLFNQLLLNDAIEKQHHNSDPGIISHNTCEYCAVCFKGPSVDNETYLVEPFIKHHVTYFPQKMFFLKWMIKFYHHLQSMWVQEVLKQEKLQES